PGRRPVFRSAGLLPGIEGVWHLRDHLAAKRLNSQVFHVRSRAHVDSPRSGSSPGQKRRFPAGRGRLDLESDRSRAMRVMVIVKATKNSEAGVMPSKQLLADMGKFNEELVKAGIMLDGDGLKPSSKGKRIRFSPGNKRTVIDGPFTETKELVAGFWI